MYRYPRKALLLSMCDPNSQEQLTGTKQEQLIVSLATVNTQEAVQRTIQAFSAQLQREHHQATRVWLAL